MTNQEIIISPTHIYGKVGSKLTLPSHIPNPDGQATHPSVVFNPDGWNGYKYWMAMTPYPGANDDHEDPNVLASHDGIKWVVPTGLVNPLDDATGSPADYNSDTEIAWGPDGYLYVFWRNLNPAATGAEESIYYRRSLNGKTWEPKVLAYTSDQKVRRLLSPTLEFENGRWTMWAVDIVAAPFKLVKLVSKTASPSWASGWGAPVNWKFVGAVLPDTKQPWHVHVTKAYGRYHALVNDTSSTGGTTRGALVYMTSADGLTWSSGLNSVIPISKPGQHDVLYRGCMIPAVERGVAGFRVWYGAFKYTSPQVWNVFRTFISDGPHSVRSSFILPALAGSGAFTSRYISFADAGGREFKYTPDISFNSTSAAIGLAVSQITTVGFMLHIDNWSPVKVQNVEIRWSASERTD